MNKNLEKIKQSESPPKIIKNMFSELKLKKFSIIQKLNYSSVKQNVIKKNSSITKLEKYLKID